MKTQNYLTRREFEVLNLLSSGHSTPEIAKELLEKYEVIEIKQKNEVSRILKMFKKKHFNTFFTYKKV